MENTSYWLPTIPYNVIDSINRVYAATGSVRIAQLASNADYNGHSVGVTWNSYRGYWVTEYYFGERVVLCRGEFEPCVRAGHEEYARGAKGTKVICCITDSRNIPQIDLTTAKAILEKYSYVPHSPAIEKNYHDQHFSDPRFSEVAGALMYEKHFGCPATAFLIQSATVEEYKEKVKQYFEARRKK